MKSVIFLAVIGGFALTNPTQSVTAAPIKFLIDPSQSYVEAYVFNGWVSHNNNPWETSVYWTADWGLSTFQLTGSFTVQTIPSGSSPIWNHLSVVKNETATDAPKYAAFSLPFFYSTYGQNVSYSSHPCFDSGFYDPPSTYTSCFGMELGLTRYDRGTLINEVLDITGAISDPMNFWGPFPYSIVLPFGTTPDPQLGIDYSYLNGLFQYRMVAVVAAVPEPETSWLMLMGLGLLALIVRQRKSELSGNNSTK